MTIKIPAFVPGPVDIVREAMIVIGGAILAALIISNVPPLRDWIKAQWQDTPHPLA
ncbi:hypothetical protein GN316_03015 [Xylophilus sp. Kf1]|nr:hypothetical protein [Xylophilus sp. Kf1]